MIETMVSCCIECGSQKIRKDVESDELLCEACGLVISEPDISFEPEWRAYSLREHNERSRVGQPISFQVYDRGLTTMIAPTNFDFQGKKLSKEEKYKMFRLRRRHIQANMQYSDQKNIAQAMPEISRLAFRVNAPNAVKEQAAFIYRKAVREKMCRGISINILAAASLYTAFRITETPKSLNEIADHSQYTSKAIAREYRKLVTRLGIRIPVSKPHAMVTNIAAKVGMKESTRRMALEFLDEAKRLRLTSGRGPAGLAAAALYIAGQLNDDMRSQVILAKASGVTEVTIRNRYKDMKNKLDIQEVK